MTSYGHSLEDSQDPEIENKDAEEITTTDGRVTWRKVSNNWGINCCPHVTITSKSPTRSLYPRVLGTYTLVSERDAKPLYKQAGDDHYLTRSPDDFTWMVVRSPEDRRGVVKSSSPGPCAPPDDEWVVTGEDSEKLLLTVMCDPDPIRYHADNHP